MNAQDEDGFTPLHYAIIERNYPFIRLLLQAGAKVDVQSKFNDSPKRYGDTPLSLAVEVNADKNIVRLFHVLPIILLLLSIENNPRISGMSSRFKLLPKDLVKQIISLLLKVT